MENKQKWTATFRLHNEFDEQVNAFNSLLADSAITCQMEDYSRATVSFAVSTRPGFPTDGNPAIHLMEEGSVFDIAYWLDNSEMDIRVLKWWIEYREMLENSCAGEYLNAPSLEDFHKHPEDIIPASPSTTTSTATRSREHRPVEKNISRRNNTRTEKVYLCTVQLSK